MLVDKSVVARFVAFRFPYLVSFIELVGRIEMVPVVKRFAHVGKEEAIARLALESLWQGAANEDAVAIGVAQGFLSLCREIDALECATAYFLLTLPESLCQLPVILDLIVVLSHTDV